MLRIREHMFFSSYYKPSLISSYKYLPSKKSTANKVKQNEKNDFYEVFLLGVALKSEVNMSDGLIKIQSPFSVDCLSRPGVMTWKYMEYQSTI